MVVFKNNRKSMIDRNVAKRQALKKKWDRHCKYGVEETDLVSGVDTLFSHEREADFSSRNEENWVRMLDEGTVVDGDGFCYAVIKKGVLKEFYDNLSDDFEGYIDKDHIYAIRLGKYTKNDMRLVKVDNERYAIDINVKLDDDYYATRDLLKQGEHRAVSVEMKIDFDEFGLADKITGDKKQGKYLVPIINKVDIIGYAVCENPKNANSIKDDLLDKASVEEGNEMNDEELKKLAAEDAAQAEEASEEKTEEAAEVGEAEDEDAVETPGTASEEEKAELEAEETDGATEGEEPEEEAAAEGPADEDAATEEGLEQLGAAIKELRAQLSEKDAKIAELENQLAAKAEKKAMSTADRVAELLSLATCSTPSAAEGSKVETPSNDLADKYAADDAAWDEAAKAFQY